MNGFTSVPNLNKVLYTVNKSPINTTEIEVSNAIYSVVYDFTFTASQDMILQKAICALVAKVVSSDPSDGVGFVFNLYNNDYSIRYWRSPDLASYDANYTPYSDESDATDPFYLLPVQISKGDILRVRIYAKTLINVDPATLGYLKNAQFTLEYEPITIISDGWS